ncbi:MAG: hypothetical protein GXY83_23575 [Rhodopirellula sp.]|nr:hypothetical protein [Rhodopirellula sp.]
MIHVPENEMLSAYLDGELTAEEEASVAELLRSSPSAQPLLDELRTLSATIQSLPAEKVGVDLRDAVLRSAERRMLEKSPGPLRGRDGNLRTAFRGVVRRILRPRAMVWSGLAIAVALVMLIALPDGGDQDQIARRPAAVEPPSRSAAEMRAVEPLQADSAIAATESDENRSSADRVPAVSAEKSPEATPELPMTAASEPPTAERNILPEPVAPLAAESPSTVASVPATDRPATESDDPSSQRVPETAVAAEMQADDANRSTEKPGRTKTASQPAESVLLVRCDVPSDNALEELSKILAGKGITVQSGALTPKTEDGDHRVAAKTIRIDAEAAPEQVEAAIATMRAQPDSFALVKQQSLTGDAALAWSPAKASEAVVFERSPGDAASDKARSSTLAAGESAPSATSTTQSLSGSGAIRYRIGASIRKPSPSVKSRVHFDRDAAPAESKVEEKAPEAAPAAKRQRVVFLLTVVVSDATSSGAPGQP